MSMNVSSVISRYTYSNAGQVRPSLDKNSDGAWSKQELGNYAADYKSVTGKELDTSKLIEKYDTDGNGVLGATEYESVISDDALDIAGVLALQSEETPAATFEHDSSDLSSWLDTLSSLKKNALTKATFMAEQTSSLISSMLPSNNSLTTLTYAISQYDSAKAFASSGLSSLSSLLDTRA